MMRNTLLTTVVLLLGHSVLAAEGETKPVADKRPTKIWNRTGPLGETPKHVADAYPLSDQDNKGGWIKFEPMTDEFEGRDLDLTKWNRGVYWWKGRQPALFSDKNVTVSRKRSTGAWAACGKRPGGSPMTTTSLAWTGARTKSGMTSMACSSDLSRTRTGTNRCS
jgi:hypothetical protein